ncbi:TetR/AcrR family transcriptional regulator [Nocardiopsis sp. MG754419]|uniref:TetR/AcrR family transcriptional regulator n=1 Tax=Nocardiopsis sp. MG754419 TaxID=2259865 RepID=UPI001BA5C849|nr:TetR/AcrR family transcriptional regulator [Nocardiopsis sp. MG754419]MBR8745244.1 hypothetical protein [Nocardiopsis sp. MG754419]
MNTEREAQAQGVSRRERILAAALEEFGHKGLHGGSTVTIAAKAKSSHPGLFRMFPTKKGLFLAVLEQVFATIGRESVAVDQAAQGDRLQVTVMTWRALMEERELMLLLVQGYAASADPDVHDLMCRWTRETFGGVEDLSRVGADPTHRFFATAMVYMVASCLDLSTRVEDEAWVGRLLASRVGPSWNLDL